MDDNETFKLPPPVVNYLDGKGNSFELWRIEDGQLVVSPAFAKAIKEAMEALP